MAALLRPVPDIDALMCANDLIALGALDVLRAAGKRVPQDVAVVGMDDTDLAAASWPSLTSVSLGSAERGKAAAELLLDRLRHGEREPRLVTVLPRLVVPRVHRGRGVRRRKVFMTATATEAGPRRRRAQATQGRLAGRPAVLVLMLPALVPVLLFSVGPLLYGIGLAFTDARGGPQPRRPASSAWRTSARCSRRGLLGVVQGRPDLGRLGDRAAVPGLSGTGAAAQPRTCGSGGWPGCWRWCRGRCRRWSSA